MQSIISLVLAGGSAHPSLNGRYTGPKALIPVNNRPIVETVIQALENSNAEQVFVVQDTLCRLQSVVNHTPKTIFITKESRYNSFGLGILSALQTIAEQYGPHEIKRRTIMIVPCDIPLATTSAFNNLMALAAGSDAEVLITFIREQCLKNRFPSMRCKTILIPDLGSRYTLQNITFVKGSYLRTDERGAESGLSVSVRGWSGNDVYRLAQTIDGLRRNRKTILQTPHFIYEFFLRRMLGEGQALQFVALMRDILLQRLTTKIIFRYVNTVFRINCGYIESQWPEISADIDKPEDFAVVCPVVSYN